MIVKAGRSSTEVDPLAESSGMGMSDAESFNFCGAGVSLKGWSYAGGCEHLRRW